MPLTSCFSFVYVCVPTTLYIEQRKGQRSQNTFTEIHYFKSKFKCYFLSDLSDVHAIYYSMHELLSPFFISLVHCVTHLKCIMHRITLLHKRWGGAVWILQEHSYKRSPDESEW